MNLRWFLVPLLILLLSTIAFSQKLINGFTRELAIHGLPAGFSLKSFDVTGDSAADFFVLTGNQLQGFDGKTFSMIFKDSAAPGTANLSSADVNRDGVVDLVASSSDTTIVVWYGPNFQNQRVFKAPVTGFTAFSPRMLQNGSVEFFFGFDYEGCDTLWYCISPPGFQCDRFGQLREYLDTAFNFVDSRFLSYGLTNLSIFDLPGGGNQQMLLIGRDVYSRDCMPSGYSNTLTASQFDTIATGIASFAVYTFPDAPCGTPQLKSAVIGNVDADSDKEFIWYAAKENYYTVYCPSKWEFKVFDLLAGVNQWVRTDSLGILSLFTVDLNGDGIQELVSYEMQTTLPGLVEYRTSDGATLGFTQLPFTPSVLQVGLFGSPPAPRVLLGDGDSLVVYRICMAASKGDLNADGSVTILDIPLELNCVFLGMGTCDLCLTDVNCDGELRAADVVLELLAVFLQTPFPCS